MRSSRHLLMVFVYVSIVACSSAWADQKFPNRIEVSPSPESSPHPHLTSVPAPRTGNSGSALSPENGSAMGLGISIPLGRPKVLPTQQESPDTDQPDDSQSE